MEQLPSSRYKEKERLYCVNCARELTDLDSKVDTLCVIDQNHVIRIPVKNVLSQIYSLKFLNVFESEEETVNEEPQVLCFLCSNKLKCCYETYLDFNHARDSVSFLSKKIQRLENFVVTSTFGVPNSKSDNTENNNNNHSNGLSDSKLVVDPVNTITGDSGYGYSSVDPPDDDYEDEEDDDGETTSSTENNVRNNSKDLSGSEEDQDSFQGGRNISFEVIQSEDEENLPGTSSQVRVMKSISTPHSVEKSRCSITSSRIFPSNTRPPPNSQHQYTPIKFQQSSSSSNKVIRKPPKKYIVQFECQICNSIFDSIEELNEHTSIIHSIKPKNTIQQSNTIATTTQIESHGRVLRSSPNKNELLLQQVQISVVKTNSRKSKKSLQTQSRESFTERESEDTSEGGNESDSFLLSPESIQAAVMPTRYNTRGRSASNSNSSSPSKQIISSNKTLPCEIRNLNEVQRVEEGDEELDADADNEQDNEKDKTFSPRQRGRIASTSTSTSRRSSESGKRRSNRRRISNPNLEVSRYWTKELLYPPRRRGVKVEPIVDIPLPEGKSKPPFACPYCPLDQQQVLVFQNIDDYETHVKEIHLGLKRLTSTDNNSEEDEEDFFMDDGGDDDDNNKDDNTHQNVPNKTSTVETQNPCSSESKEQGNGDYPSLEETERNNNNNTNNNNSSSSKISNVNRKKVVSTKMSQAQIRYTFYNCPPFQCPYCELTGAKTLDVIRNHLKCYHLKFDSTCNYCAEIFPTKANLREHIPNCPKCSDPSAAVALLAGKKNKQQEKSTGSSPGSWICEFCGKDYSSRVYMSKHISRVHGDTKFQCPCCPKTFRTRTYLSRHMDCHVTSRQFVCETCGGTYKSAHHLRLHTRRTHNPEVREKLKMYHKKKDREYKIKRKAEKESTVV